MIHFQRALLVVVLAGTLLGLRGLIFGSSSSAELIKEKNKALEQKVSSLQDEVERLQEELALARANTSSHSKKKPGKVISKTTIRWDKHAKDDPFLGSGDAPVLLMAFSDYQCEPCRAFVRETLPQIKKNLLDSGKVKFVFRDLPLSKHKNAPLAAAIANCAGEQGQYWKMHDALFSNPTLVDSGKFSDIYFSIKTIDSLKLERCVESQRYGKEIVKDAEAGAGIGARGAPGFFIGTRDSQDTYSGALIRGAQPFEVFEVYTKQLLAKKRQG